jgi:pimeloyl-ACP methyl ester carboxylesterase
MALQMEGHLEHAGHRTWYRVVGDLDQDASLAPVVICHGGPGATHDYVEPIASGLSGSGRACVLYDQLGNGRSDHLPDADPSFWTVELFERELRRWPSTSASRGAITCSGSRGAGCSRSCTPWSVLRAS